LHLKTRRTVLILPLQQPGALYIDGAFVAPGEGHEDPVFNPATEEVIAMAPYGGHGFVAHHEYP
jgi:hypothetical protein